MKKTNKIILFILAAIISIVSLFNSKSFNIYANIITNDIIDKESNDNCYLIRLHSGDKYFFTSPSRYSTNRDINISSPSKIPLPIASSSNIESDKIIKSIQKVYYNSDYTEFAVNSNILPLSYIDLAVIEAGINNYSQIFWTTSKGDINNIITEDLKLSNNWTDLYALYPVNANMENCSVLDDGSIFSISKSDITLDVSDLNNDDKILDLSDLKEAVHEAGKKYEGLNYNNLIQLSISSLDNCVDCNIRMHINLRNAFLNKTVNENNIFVLQKNNGKWENINIDSINSETIEFNIKNVGALIIGLYDKQLINVLLQEIPDGIGFSTIMNNDTKFLPVGEMVQVPEGTELRFGAIDVNHIIDGMNLPSFKIKEEKSNIILTKKWNETYIVPNDKGSITITPVLEKRKDSYIYLDPSEITESYGYKGIIHFVNNGEDKQAYNWRLSNEDSLNGIIKIDNNGNVHSIKNLNSGYNAFRVFYDFNNKTYDDFIEIWSGPCVTFNLFLGEYNGKSIGYKLYKTQPLNYGKNFNELLNEISLPEFGFFGDYEFIGWYTEDGKNEFNGNISEITNVYARFKNKKTGKVYNPIIKRSKDESVDNKPSNPNKPINPIVKPNIPDSNNNYFSSGSSEGYSDRYKYTNELSGTWNKDEKGWWLKLRTGGYAKDTWGIVNGIWYYFGFDGYMKTGWLLWNGGWYYLNPEEGTTQGQMKTGWVFDKALNGWFYLDKDGKMGTGWQQIGGEWYYFNPVTDGTKGTMMTNQWIGNYFVGTSGAWERSKSK